MACSEIDSFTPLSEGLDLVSLDDFLSDYQRLDGEESSLAYTPSMSTGSSNHSDKDPGADDSSTSEQDGDYDDGDEHCDDDDPNDQKSSILRPRSITKINRLVELIGACEEEEMDTRPSTLQPENGRCPIMELPTEIRLKIWQLAQPTNFRTVRINGVSLKINDNGIVRAICRRIKAEVEDDTCPQWVVRCSTPSDIIGLSTILGGFQHSTPARAQVLELDLSYEGYLNCLGYDDDSPGLWPTCMASASRALTIAEQEVQQERGKGAGNGRGGGEVRARHVEGAADL